MHAPRLAFWISGSALALLVCLSPSVHAASTRGLVRAMTPLEGSSYCELAVDDELAGRTLYFIAHKSVCEQRTQWVGRRAVFHLSLVDFSGKLEPVATRVRPWTPISQ